MSDYLIRLLEYIEAGNSLVGVPGRPVSPELVRRVVYTCCPFGRMQKTPRRTVAGTSLYRSRSGFLVNYVLNGRWQTLLGRICSVGENIDSRHRLKTLGGMAKDSDFSILYSLLREMREELSMLKVRKNSISPVYVTSCEKGVLQFFSGNLKSYPVLDPGEFRTVAESDSSRTVIRYFTVDELLNEYSKGDEAIVNPETVEAALMSYFWSRSRKLHFSDDDSSSFLPVIDGGDIEIPSETREFIFRRAGLDSESGPLFKRCSVYFSLPTQAKVLPAVRMLLVNDLFLYTKEFGPEHFLSGNSNKVYKANDIKSRGHVYEEAASFVRQYFSSKFEEIFLEDIPNMYFMKSG